jgi:hypothetical protein
MAEWLQLMKWELYGRKETWPILRYSFNHSNEYANYLADRSADNNSDWNGIKDYWFYMCCLIKRVKEWKELTRHWAINSTRSFVPYCALYVELRSSWFIVAYIWTRRANENLYKNVSIYSSGNVYNGLGKRNIKALSGHREEASLLLNQGEGGGIASG